jgi:hypothetical protein
MRGTKAIQEMGKVCLRSNSKGGASAKAGVPGRFRRLKWNELVSRGDFVADERRKFELWEGPAGFRADAFVRPIYRRDNILSTAAKK